MKLHVRNRWIFCFLINAFILACGSNQESELTNSRPLDQVYLTTEKIRQIESVKSLEDQSGSIIQFQSNGEKSFKVGDMVALAPNAAVGAKYGLLEEIVAIESGTVKTRSLPLVEIFEKYDTEGSVEFGQKALPIGVQSPIKLNVMVEEETVTAEKVENDQFSQEINPANYQAMTMLENSDLEQDMAKNDPTVTKCEEHGGIVLSVEVPIKNRKIFDFPIQVKGGTQSIPVLANGSIYLDMCFYIKADIVKAGKKVFGKKLLPIYKIPYVIGVSSTRGSGELVLSANVAKTLNSFLLQKISLPKDGVKFSIPLTPEIPLTVPVVTPVGLIYLTLVPSIEAKATGDLFVGFASAVSVSAAFEAGATHDYDLVNEVQNEDLGWKPWLPTPKAPIFCPRANQKICGKKRACTPCQAPKNVEVAASVRLEMGPRLELRVSNSVLSAGPYYHLNGYLQYQTKLIADPNIPPMTLIAGLEGNIGLFVKFLSFDLLDFQLGKAPDLRKQIFPKL